jgi:hypothetical protein
MEEEHRALLANNTWDLVARPPGTNVVSGKWIFKHKFHADGTLERYKARWVVRGFTQRPGIDFDETFIPVVKPATVHTVLSLALSRQWPVHQLDVKNAFLHGILTETVYCSQPMGFKDSAHPGFVCRLNKSLYGLKQAPRAWYSRFATFLLSLGFVESKADTSLFVLRRGSDTAYLLLYVDDIVLTASSASLRQHIIGSLQQEFSMKDLGQLHHFLGMHVQRQSDGLLLSQRQYMIDILDRAGMAACKPCSTPVDVNPKLSSTDGDLLPAADATDFRRLADALQYLTFTRPDIAYAVQQVCLHMHAPRASHLSALKRILRYMQGTLHLGLYLRPSNVEDLVVYSDADWAGCPDTRRSTSGYAVFLGTNLVSWSSKRQATVSRSSAEAKVLSPMQLLRCPGFANSSRSFTRLSAVPPWCSVTTSVPSTCPAIQFSTSVQSTLRSICTLYVIRLPLDTSRFSKFRPPRSSVDGLPGVSVQSQRRWQRRSDCGGC